MFTGLVEEVGTLLKIEKGTHSAVLWIGAKKVLEGTKIGDSIAANGVCLTVTDMKAGCYSVDVMHETMNRSSLGQLRAGDPLNLERAMAADGRFGGHIVSGHIDGMGTISHMERDDNAIWYTVSAKEELLRYIVEKGSITIDGISLTVAKVTSDSFQVSIIPHTQKETNLHTKKIGSVVNLECDIIGKYVEKLMMPKSATKQSKISEAFLAEHGFC